MSRFAMMVVGLLTLAHTSFTSKFHGNSAGIPTLLLTSTTPFRADAKCGEDLPVFVYGKGVETWAFGDACPNTTSRSVTLKVKSPYSTRVADPSVIYGHGVPVTSSLKGWDIRSGFNPTNKKTYLSSDIRIFVSAEQVEEVTDLGGYSKAEKHYRFKLRPSKASSQRALAQLRQLVKKSGEGQ